MNIITTVSTNNRVSMCLLMSISSWILLNIKLIREVTTWHMKQAGEGAASRETECCKCVGVVSELSKYSLFVKSVTPPLLHQNRCRWIYIIHKLYICFLRETTNFWFNVAAAATTKMTAAATTTAATTKAKTNNNNYYPAAPVNRSNTIITLLSNILSRCFFLIFIYSNFSINTILITITQSNAYSYIYIKI